MEEKRFVLVIKRWLVWPKTSISIHAKLEYGISCTSPIERLPVEQLDRSACKGGLNIAEVCDVGIESDRPKVLGQRIAEARKARGVTQEDAAKHLECSRPILIAMEKGTRP